LSSPDVQDQYSATSFEKSESDIEQPAVRIRFQFSKQEEVKFISHLDVIRAFTRAFRRAGIPIAYSHGFNPHPKIGFGSVLPVGTISKAEFVDVDLEEYMEASEFASRVNAELPAGLEILEVQEVSLKERPLMGQVSLASYIVRIPEIEGDPASKIESIMDMDHIWIEKAKSNKRSNKRGRQQTETSSFIDIKPLIRSLKLLGKVDGTLELEMLLGDSNEGKLRPEAVVRLIRDGLAKGNEDEQNNLLSQMEIQKTGSFIEHQGQLFSPMESVSQ